MDQSFAASSDCLSYWIAIGLAVWNRADVGQSTDVLLHRSEGVLTKSNIPGEFDPFCRNADERPLKARNVPLTRVGNKVTLSADQESRFSFHGKIAVSYNPFEAPAADTRVVGVVSGSREDLVKVAKYQKGILVCLLIYFVVIVGQFAIPPQLRQVLGVGVLVLGLVAAVFTILLAMKTHGTVLGIILGLLCVVPILGLLILLLVNQKATTVLQSNGIKVGLLGVDLSSL